MGKKIRPDTNHSRRQVLLKQRIITKGGERNALCGNGIFMVGGYNLLLSESALQLQL